MEAALLELLQQAKKAGSSASLLFTTVGGTTKAKFEIELPSSGGSPAAAPPPIPTLTSFSARSAEGMAEEVSEIRGEGGEKGVVRCWLEMGQPVT